MIFFFLALFLVGACVMFPLGWNSKEVREACGKTSKRFQIGDCTIGWSAMVIAGGTLAAFLCSCLSIKAGKSDRMKASAYEAKYDTMQLKEKGWHV